MPSSRTRESAVRLPWMVMYWLIGSRLPPTSCWVGAIIAPGVIVGVAAQFLVDRQREQRFARHDLLLDHVLHVDDRALPRHRHRLLSSPTFRSALMLAVKFDVRMIDSRRTVLKPVIVNVTS